MNIQSVGRICHTCAVIISHDDDSMYDMEDAATARKMRDTFATGEYALTGGRSSWVEDDKISAGVCGICGENTIYTRTEERHSLMVDLDDPITAPPALCPELGGPHTFASDARDAECRFCGTWRYVASGSRRCQETHPTIGSQCVYVHADDDPISLTTWHRIRVPDVADVQWASYAPSEV
jgi:hypothetical protein